MGKSSIPNIKDLRKKSFKRLGIGAAMNVGGLIANPILYKSAMNDKPESDERESKILDRFAKTKLGANSEESYGSYGYNPRTNTVYRDDNSTSHAHEVGHAHNFHKGRIKGNLRMRLYGHSKGSVLNSSSALIDQRARNMTMIHPATLASAATGVLRAKRDLLGKKSGKLIRYSPELIAGAVAAPMLYEEGKASVKGYHMLKKLRKRNPNAARMNRSSIKHFGKLFSTYGTLATASAGTNRMAHEAAYQLALLHHTKNHGAKNTRK